MSLPYELFHGRMERVLDFFPDNHFHACATDPPYNMGKSGFMGKDWDKSLPTVEEFKALYRVMRPGAHIVVFSGTRTFHRMWCVIEDAGFEIRDKIEWIYGQGFPKSKNNHELGLGTALKPASEPICLARKPLDGTLEENRLKWGTGYLNIDACRIPGQPWKYGAQPDIRNAGFTPGQDRPLIHARNVVGGENGRWPANILHDGSDEVRAVFPVNDTPSGKASGDTMGTLGTNGIFNGQKRRDDFEPEFYGDTGSAARFFYESKASRADRNEGCEKLVSKPMLWSSGTENPGSFQSPGTEKSSPNFWPTVKPTNLMRYLIRLITPKGDDVKLIDPYNGSGSTGKAAMFEFVPYYAGIDMEEDAIKISECRIKWALKNRGSMNIF